MDASDPAKSAIDAYRHAHDFLGEHHDRNARKTWAVVALTSVMMVIEIGAGAVFHSMALLADGIHMATHAGAMLIAAAAYMLARRRQFDRRFSFGTGKFGDLGAFSSAIILALSALLVGYESIERLINPETIAFDQAIPVAVLGLIVNLASAWLLRDDHSHHGHGPEHRHDHSHDLNLRAAYIHVASDAAVSLLAIVGLLAGRQLGWTWMDPLMGLIGSLVIARWSWGLLKAAGSTLLDATPAGGLDAAIVERLEAEGDRVVDLHVWRIGPGSTAAIVSILARGAAMPTAHYKARLRGLSGLRHVTVEVVTDPADAAHDHGHDHEHDHAHGHHHHHHHHH